MLSWAAYCPFANPLLWVNSTPFPLVGFSWVDSIREGPTATSATWVEDLLAASSAMLNPWVDVAGMTAQALTDRGVDS